MITILIGVMVFCFGMALIGSSSYQPEIETQILYKVGNPLTGREGIALLELEDEREELLNVTLWGEIQGQTLRFEEFNRETEVDLVVIIGDSSLLFSSGYSLSRGVENEILLSPDVAHRLFGNSLAANVYIMYDGKEYIFRGILSDAENTAVIQANRQTPRVLDAAVVEIPKNLGQSSIIREFESRFWQVERVFDLILLRAFGNVFIILLPVIIGGTLMFKGLKKSFNYRNYPVKSVTWLALTCIILLSFLWLNQSLPKVEFGFAPPMWSDFQYWRSFFVSTVGTANIMLGEYWRQPEQIAFERMVTLIRYGLFAAGLFIFIVRKVAVDNWWLILLYCSGSFGATFMVIINNSRNNFPGVESLWWLMCFYLVAKKLLEVDLDRAKNDEKIVIVFGD
jgi:hypothetical protein